MKKDEDAKLYVIFCFENYIIFTNSFPIFSLINVRHRVVKGV